MVRKHEFVFRESGRQKNRFMKRIISAGLLACLVLTAGVLAAQNPVKVGMIGLDTSHSIAFTKLLNDPEAGPELSGFPVVAAYPKGSPDIESSVSRVPGYTEQMQEMGVEIVGSIGELLKKVDVVLLETNDGRPHLKQALPVMQAGKPLFIDKPIAASLVDAVQIFDAAGKYQVPVFSASSLRYFEKADAIRNGEVGDVLGASTYSPAPLEITHPDLFWYGIHGVEMLFTIMGTGCRTVMRANTAGTDVVVGIWADGRIGTFRGLRAGTHDYGGTVFGSDKVEPTGGYAGYRPLVVEIVKFFRTGVAPVSPQETLEIFAFMEAADRSKTLRGVPVDMQSVLREAKREARTLTREDDLH